MEKDGNGNDAVRDELVKPDSEEEGGEAPVVEYYFGVGKLFRPKWLQVFRSPYFFSFIFCCDILFGGAVSTGFISVTLSSIQRRYDLTTTQTGVVVSVFDIAVIIATPFVSYFGEKGHKPRWLGIGLLLQGFGAFVYSLPVFIFGKYGGSSSTLSPDVCSSVNFLSDIGFSDTGNATEVQCDSSTSDQYSLVLFIVGNMLIGFGAAPLLPIGASYLDDIIKPKYVPIHLGFAYSTVILGPALGFGLGSAFLSTYVDFWEETMLEPTDPAFVGAWWIGFLFSWVACWIFAVPMLMFPRLFPDSHTVAMERKEKLMQKYKWKGPVSNKERTILEEMRLLPYQLWHLFSTLSWLFITMAMSVGAFVVQGLASFLPLYFEISFNLTSAAASIIGGGVAIAPAALGALIGGMIIFCAKLEGRRVALVNWIVTLMGIPPLLGFLIHCPNLDIAGVTKPYAIDQFIIEGISQPINATCSLSCNCNFQSNVYQPVCGGDGLTYTSPCRAGCSVSSNEDTGKNMYHNCSCIEDNLKEKKSSLNYTAEDALRMSTASEGVCDDGCIALPIFAAFSVISILLLAITVIPNVVITIRCVSDDQRTFALGIQSAIFRIFGNVPGPIIFGVAFDAACKFRNFKLPCESTTAVQGACWEYDRTVLSNTILAMSMVAIVLNLAFAICSWLAYPKAVKDMSDLSADTTINQELKGNGNLNESNTITDSNTIAESNLI